MGFAGGQSETNKPPCLRTVEEQARLNYEHRQIHHLPGSADSDWLDAERDERQVREIISRAYETSKDHQPGAGQTNRQVTPATAA